MNDLTVHDELLDEEKREVVKLLAEFHDIPEVQKHIKKNFNKSLAYNSVKFYLHSKKWAPMLERLRAEFVQPIMSVAVSHKFVRLTRLEDLYTKTMTNKNLKEIEKLREAREILSEARAEIEGSKSNPTGDLYITQINKFSDEDLLKRKTEVLNRIRSIDIGATK